MGLFKPKRPSQYPSTLLWFFDQTHVTVTALTAVVLILTRDPHVAWFSIGALGSSLTAKVVKKFIRDPRPPPKESSPSPVRPKKTYGFPSTHSTALSFYLFYILPILLSTPSGTVSNPIFIPLPFSSSSSFLSTGGSGGGRGGIVADFVGLFYSNGFIGFLVAYWAGGIWSRVKLGYHTPEQVVGGVLFGMGLAMGWRSVWRNNDWVRDGLGSLINVVWNHGVRAFSAVRHEL